MTALYCFVTDNRVHLGPRECPSTFRNVSNFNELSDPDKAAYGWLRYIPATPSPGCTIILDALVVDGITVRQEIRGERLLSELSAETAAAATAAAATAAESARRATPIVFDQPIEAPLLSLLSQSAGKGVALTATDEGQLVTVIIHESPWPDTATLTAKIAAALATHRAARAKAKDGLNGQLQTRLENLERLAGLRP
jgi:hypothetical protein